MKKIIYYLFTLGLVCNITWAQPVSDIDVIYYEHSISLSDSSDIIVGISNIEILFHKNVENFSLDLIQKNSKGKGMVVSKVTENGEKVDFQQNQDKINISSLLKTIGKRNYIINYQGIPQDGLIISSNKYGDRTFFGDNWPNRARNWMPCVDHPFDKALVTFKITAPTQYQVVANGMLTEETDLNNGNTYYVWKTNVPIPTKVMVIGVAKFAVEYIGDTHNIPLSSWVYPQEREAGFYDLAITKQVLDFFIENVGDYPYQKLASVQSKTRYGGLENASAIFYNENFIKGDRSNEEVIAHEVAHQWFGNSATEIDWPHLWLSEGFATYFASLYMKYAHGSQTFNELALKDREEIISFSKTQLTPIVDYETKDLLKLLNQNTYQKGGWILHMLKNQIGEALFWEGIRKYYNTYKLSNASTEDLRSIFEKVSGEDLKQFFDQWLYSAGHPILSFTSKIDNKNFSLKITQNQDYIFNFPLEIKLIFGNGKEKFQTIVISEKNTSFSLPTENKVKDFVIDPNIKLLFEKLN